MKDEIKFPLIILAVYFLLGFAMRPFDFNDTLSEILGTAIRVILSVILWWSVRNRIREEYSKNNRIIVPVVGFLLFYTFYQKFGPGSEQALSFFSSKHIVYALSNASTGIFEELLVRATLFFGILKLVGKKQIWKAVILSSAVFAIAHLPNMFRPEGVNLSVINQIIYAFGAGLLFQSLLIRFRNLLLVIVLHSLANYWMSFSDTFQTVASFENQTSMSYDLWSSAGLFLIVVILLCVPISYVILKGGRQPV